MESPDAKGAGFGFAIAMVVVALILDSLFGLPGWLMTGLIVVGLIGALVLGLVSMSYDFKEAADNENRKRGIQPRSKEQKKAEFQALVEASQARKDAKKAAKRERRN